jgi:hypothetical protein
MGPKELLPNWSTICLFRSPPSKISLPPPTPNLQGFRGECPVGLIEYADESGGIAYLSDNVVGSWTGCEFFFREDIVCPEAIYAMLQPVFEW